MYKGTPNPATGDTIGVMPSLRSDSETLHQAFLEMRGRCISLAADLDRVQRSPGGAELITTDPRLARIRQSLLVLLENTPGRAERVQTIFSDLT